MRLLCGPAACFGRGIQQPFTYKLTDAAYAKLLHKLDGHYIEMPPELRTDILAFYEDLSLPIATKTNAGEWTRLQEELQHLGAIDHDVSPVRPRVAAGLAIPAAK